MIGRAALRTSIAFLALVALGLPGLARAQGMANGSIVPHRVLLPSYPEAARLARRDGLVELDVSIDGTGTVAAIDVLKSECPLLDDTARDAVQQWRFDPQAGRVQCTVRFFLGDWGGERCTPPAVWLAPGMVTVYGHIRVIERSGSPL